MSTKTAVASKPKAPTTKAPTISVSKGARASAKALAAGNRATKATVADAPVAILAPTPTPAEPIDPNEIPERYKDLPREGALKLARADAIHAAKPSSEWTKDEKKTVRAGLTIMHALRSMGFTVERPAPPRKASHGGGGRKMDTDRTSAENVDLREKAEAAAKIPKKARSESDRLAIVSWRNRDRHIRIKLNEPAPIRSTRGGKAKSFRLYFPTVPVVSACQFCTDKESTVRVVNHSTGEHKDACGGCALDEANRRRSNNGDVVTLLRIKDGVVQLPDQTMSATGKLTVVATA